MPPEPPAPQEPPIPKGWLKGKLEFKDGLSIEILAPAEHVTDQMISLYQEHGPKAPTIAETPDPDPTPVDYDEPFEQMHWGVLLPDGTVTPMPSEKTARLAAAAEGFTLISRIVTYDVWRVAPATPQ